MIPEMQKADKKTYGRQHDDLLIVLDTGVNCSLFYGTIGAFFVRVQSKLSHDGDSLPKKYDRRKIMRDEEQQRKERQAKLLAAIERQIAYKNIEFTIAHQNDTKDELAAYLKACMDDIGHAPR